MRPGLGVLWVAGVLAWSGAAQALTVEQLSRHAQGRVVHLSVRDDRGDEDGSGSGFVISREGRVATNYHVIENAPNVVAVFPDKREVKVTGVWAFDKDIDLAVLQLERATYEPLVLAQEPAHEGEDIVLVGSPLGLGNSISSGIVSAVRDQGIDKKRFGEALESWSLQVTAAAAPGSSGSPILRSNGEVLGVLVGHLDGLEGASFAIGVDRLWKVAATASQQVRPLNAATGVRTVRTNLLISGAVLGLAALLWVVVSKMHGRRRADA